MAQGRPRDARKQQQWQRWIQQWQASGLSVRAFCARYGLAENPKRFQEPKSGSSPAGDSRADSGDDPPPP
jgi:hypothetical protein